MSVLIAAAGIALGANPALAQHGGMSGGGGMGGSMPGGSGSMSPGGAGMGMDRSGGMSGAMSERQLHAERLQRTYHDLLDFDPHGNLIVRNEVMGIGVTPRGLEAAAAAGFAVTRQEMLTDLGTTIVALTPPKGMSARKALKALHEFDPGASFDYNHIYLASSLAAGVNAAPQVETGPTAVAQDHARASSLRVGLIDGGVAPNHPGLRSLTLHTHGCDGASMRSAHGTAVASRLVVGFGEPAPAQIDAYAVDVYCGAPTGGSADALVHALAWLVQQRVPVINMSVVGPPNLLLQRAVEIATGRGHLIVAAVGNDGPSAAPLYPAAYPGVVAVTGVDRKGKVLLEAGRGPFVMFAAPGSDIQAASLPDGFGDVRGTSYAAPIVAGRLALLLEDPDVAAAQRAVSELAATAVHSGARARDPIYGYGCIGCVLPGTTLRAADGR